MSLFFSTSVLIIVIWLIQNLLLLPIQVIDSFHLSNWLSLTAVILAFAWLAAE